MFQTGRAVSEEPVHAIRITLRSHSDVDTAMLLFLPFVHFFVLPFLQQVPTRPVAAATIKYQHALVLLIRHAERF